MYQTGGVNVKRPKLRYNRRMANPQLKTPASAPEPVPSRKTRVIDSVWTFVVAAFVVGPFALPLLWRNPKIKTWAKIAGTIVVVGITYFAIRSSQLAIEQALQQLQ